MRATETCMPWGAVRCIREIRERHQGCIRVVNASENLSSRLLGRLKAHGLSIRRPNQEGLAVRLYNQDQKHKLCRRPVGGCRCFFVWEAVAEDKPETARAILEAEPNSQFHPTGIPEIQNSQSEHYK